ncbi:MAG: DNA polymerase [Buchnera aphidicola (Nurudea yanoniella)]
MEKYTIIKKKEQLNELIFSLKKSNFFAFFLHISTTKNNTSSILGIAFSININNSIYLPLKLKSHRETYNITLKDIFLCLKKLFENTQITKIGYNIKSIIKILKSYNITLSNNTYDIMIAEYFLNNTIKKSMLLHNINKNLIKNNNFLKIKQNYTTVEKKNIYFSLKKVRILLITYKQTQKKINENKKTQKIFKNIDLNLIKVLNNLENNGIYVRKKILRNISNTFNAKLFYLQKKAYVISKNKFNLLSNLELTKVFPSLASPKKITQKILNILSKKHLLLKIILRYRNLYMLKNTYSDKLLNLINEKTNRIHCSYNQTNTITSRLSSSNPNLQNIPIHNKEGKHIRKAFIAPKNYLLISADYSQFELRILAHFSQDKNFLNIFSNNGDIHLITASEIFNIPIKDVDENLRYHSKLINFSIIYGMSSYGLSQKLNINIDKAKNYIEIYKKKYKKIFEYIENTKNIALKYGFILTLEGRKLFIPNIKSKYKKNRKTAEKTAISATIQGTTADIMKMSMIQINNLIENNFYKNAKMILHIHDELIFEVKKEKIHIFCKKIKYIMENIIKLSVPLIINTKIGKNWLEMN